MAHFIHKYWCPASNLKTLRLINRRNKYFIIIITTTTNIFTTTTSTTTFITTTAATITTTNINNNKYNLTTVKYTSQNIFLQIYTWEKLHWNCVLQNACVGEYVTPSCGIMKFCSTLPFLQTSTSGGSSTLFLKTPGSTHFVCLPSQTHLI